MKSSPTFSEISNFVSDDNAKKSEVAWFYSSLAAWGHEWLSGCVKERRKKWRMREREQIWSISLHISTIHDMNHIDSQCRRSGELSSSVMKQNYNFSISNLPVHPPGSNSNSQTALSLSFYFFQHSHHSPPTKTLHK